MYISIDIGLGKNLGQWEMFDGRIEMKGYLGGEMRMLIKFINNDLDGRRMRVRTCNSERSQEKCANHG